MRILAALLCGIGLLLPAVAWSDPPSGTGAGGAFQYLSGSTATGWVPAPICDQVANANPNNTTALAISAVAGKTIYMCGAHFLLTGAAVSSYQITEGTGSTCSGSNVSLGFTAPPISAGYISETIPYSPGFIVASGDNICVTSTITGSNLNNVAIYYAQR